MSKLIYKVTIKCSIKAEDFNRDVIKSIFDNTINSYEAIDRAKAWGANKEFNFVSKNFDEETTQFILSDFEALVKEANLSTDEISVECHLL